MWGSITKQDEHLGFWSFSSIALDREQTFHT